MRTNFFISLLLVIFFMNVAAQEDNTDYTSSKSKSDKESILKYGLKFGYDMYPITYKLNDIKEQLKNGYQTGVFMQIGRSIYFQPEIYYASYLNLSSSVAAEKIQSIRVPLLLGLRFLNLGIISAHLMGGPVFNTSLSKLSAGMKLDELKKNWQLGVGVDVFGFITADVRYTLLDGIDLSEQFSNFNIKTSTLNVTLGIKL